ncbi:hypothetical protein SDC9_198184 [bioreactor metagenome]|uniref:Uncharacterized protein n=1 Tax=bioreactor metagenome TaxID=1076179 RepID=A0A645IGY9_9ZZZZ
MHLEEAVMPVRRRVAAKKIGQTPESLVMYLAFRVTLVVNPPDMNIRNCLNRRCRHALPLRHRNKMNASLLQGRARCLIARQARRFANMLAI